MPAPRPSLADLPHRLREWLAGMPDRWKAWRTDLREDPTLLWRTPLVRFLAVAVLGVIALFGVQWLISALTPAEPLGAFQRPTRTATLYVACTNPSCLASFVVRRPMDFKDWPLTCPECGQQAAYRASVCTTCSHWFATAPDGQPGCPHCAARRATEHGPPTRPATSTSSDDDEDPW